MARILVVDDSPVDQQIAGSLLGKYLKAEISSARDGREALDKIKSQPFDLVVTDLQMPAMDGLQLVARMKEEHPQIPVVLMTAAGSEEIAVKALASGAASYVSKRRLAQDLCETVSQVLVLATEQRTQAEVLRRQIRWETEFVMETDMTLVMGMAGHLMHGLRGMEIVDSAEEVRVGVALAEALLNACYHGNLEVPSSLKEKSADEFNELAKQRTQQLPYKDRQVRVNARFSRGQAIFSIRDDGHGFDTSRLPDPTDPHAIEKSHGRGIFLMRSFMDEVRFNDKGNIVTMVKNAGKK